MSPDEAAGGVPARETEPDSAVASREPASTWVAVFLLVEAAVGVISLLMPITPSKTGSGGDISDWFIEDPSYLQRVLVDFVFTNVVLVVLALAFWLHLLWQKKRERRSPG